MLSLTDSLLLASAAGELGHQLPMWTVIPFALLLGAIALCPLAVPHWWEHNRNKGWVALALSVPIVGFLLVHFGHAGGEALLEKLHEYVAFIVLLAAAVPHFRAGSTCRGRFPARRWSTRGCSHSGR